MNLLSTFLFVQKFNVNHDNMSTYASILLWVVPGFMVLMTIEVIYGHFTNKQTYSFTFAFVKKRSRSSAG